MSRTPLFHQIRRRERAREVRHEAVIGQVVDNQDPDGLGRIKVKLPTLSDGDTTFWAPIASLGAGKDRGWFFLPEIDDEVLVMFAHGDLSKTVVLGALWNGSDAPPEDNGALKVLRSREGHEVVFDDDAGTITFVDGSGKGEITIADGDIKVSVTGDLVISSPADELHMLATEIKVTAKTKLEVSAGTKVAMSGNNVTLKGGASLQINGAAVQINPGGTPEADDVSEATSTIADPLG